MYIHINILKCCHCFIVFSITFSFYNISNKFSSSHDIQQKQSNTSSNDSSSHNSGGNSNSNSVRNSSSLVEFVLLIVDVV